METPLHAQKVAILSRLIKETSLTLEEALLLLKEEEQEEIVPTAVTTNQNGTVIRSGTTGTWSLPYSGTVFTTTSDSITASTANPVVGTFAYTSAAAPDLNS
jgi:hypothetical protein